MNPTQGGAHLTLRIGMISARVALFMAYKEDRVAFSSVDPDGQPVRSPRLPSSMCEMDSKGKTVVKVRSGKPLATSDIRKGYALDGQQVVLDPDEVSALLPEKSSIIKINAIVPKDSIDVDLYDTTYYIGLDSDADEDDAAFDYHAVSRMIGDNIAVGDMVLRQKHRALVVYNHGNALRLTMLRSMDSINPAPFIPPVEIDDIHDMSSEDLIASWASSLDREYDPASFVDEYKVAIMELIQCKASGGTPKKVSVVDRKPQRNKNELLAALKRNNPSADTPKSKSKEQV